MQIVYTLLLYLLQPFIWLKLLLRSRKAPAYRRRWLERYGFCRGKVKPNGILIHSVSVGETLAAVPLIKALQHKYPDLPITITTMTPTGSERVIATFANSVGHVYLPYDLPCAINRFLNQLKPKLVIIMETELWPNFISQLDKRKVPLIIANARLSERSAKGYQKLGKMAQKIMQQITLVAAQNNEDGQRFVALGLNPSHLSITGSLKFDISVSPELAAKASALKLQWAANRPVWIAASTHEGEEKIILNAHKILLKTWPNLLLILVPRHPERFITAQQLVEKNHLTYSLRSANNIPTPDVQVIIGDTMGELMLLYGIADVAFVGGSLVEHGGQNPLEPAAHGIPILMGPNTFNFREICQKLQQSGGLIVVEDEESLIDSLKMLFSDPQLRAIHGKQVADVLYQNQGALAKLLKLLEAYIPR